MQRALDELQIHDSISTAWALKFVSVIRQFYTIVAMGAEIRPGFGLTLASHQNALGAPP